MKLNGIPFVQTKQSAKAKHTMNFDGPHVLVASLIAAVLAATLIHGVVRAWETATDSADGYALDERLDAKSNRSNLPLSYLLSGNAACYRVAGACQDLQCGTGNSASLAHYNTTSTCPPGHLCAGGMAFKLGSSSTYGPWYTIVPRGATGTYQRLKIQFRGDYPVPQPVASYNPVSKTWTLAPGNGTTYQAQLVYSHPISCW